MTVEEQEMVERGKANLAQMNLNNAGQSIVDASTSGRLNAAIPEGHHVGKDGKIRKDRADRNVPRKPKPPEPAQAPAGKITSEQASRLVDLIQTRDSRRIQMENSQDQAEMDVALFDSANAAVTDFIAEITA